MTALVLASQLLLSGCGKIVDDYVTPTIEGWEYLLGIETEEKPAAMDAVPETGEQDTGDALNPEESSGTNEETADTESGALEEAIPEVEADTETETESASSWEPIPDLAGSEYRYAYQQLEGMERVIYGEILHAVRNFTEVSVSTLDKQEVDYLYNCVLCDHPELFYTDGYTVTAHSVGGVLQSLSIRGNYTFTQEEVSAAQRGIDDYSWSVLRSAPDGSTYEKVKYVYEYIIDHTTYDLNAPNNQNIVSVMVNGSSVCNGYAKSMQYLLLEMGIPATFVTGTTRGEGHAWVLVNIDGVYTYVDPTWGDAQFTGSDSDATWINYDYLCITTKDILSNHTINDTIQMPECSSEQYNYYVQEGLYFDSYDSEHLQKIVNDVYDQGENVIRLRCASAEVYEAMHEDLITNKNIYQYLRGETKLSYTQNEELHTMTIIL